MTIALLQPDTQTYICGDASNMSEDARLASLQNSCTFQQCICASLSVHGTSPSQTAYCHCCGQALDCFFHCLNASNAQVVRRHCSSYRRLGFIGTDGQTRHFIVQTGQHWHGSTGMQPASCSSPLSPAISPLLCYSMLLTTRPGYCIPSHNMLCSCSLHSCPVFGVGHSAQLCPPHVAETLPGLSIHTSHLTDHFDATSSQHSGM